MTPHTSNEAFKGVAMRSLIIYLFILLGLCIPALASAAVTPMVAAGQYHTVALKAEGTVVAWELNNYGQLGDGTTTNRLSPAAVTVAPTLYSLTTNIAGNGSINNVHQNSPAFSCASPSTNCSSTYVAGTDFTLYATPSALFDFAGWSGAGCSTGPCQLALDGNTTVTATFTPQQLLQRVGSATPYMSFSSAYGDAANGSEIRSRDAAINGDVHLNRELSVMLNGGYAAGFTTISDFTTIQGKLSIEHGSAIVSNIIVGLPAIADFTLMPPTAVTTAQGFSGASTISTTVDAGFNATVVLTASGVPTGATATFTPASIVAPGSGSAILTLTAGAVTPAGAYTITVTGTGGGSTHITTLLFTVTATLPDFTITAPASVATVQGGSGTATISTTVSGGFNASVALTMTGLPTGATAIFSPTSIAAPGSGSATLTLTAGASTPAGTYSVTVSGTGGGKTHTATISFAVVSGGSATLFSDGFESEGWSTAQVSGTEGSWTMVGAGNHPDALPHGGTMLADFNAYEATSGSRTRLYRPSGIAMPGTIGSATLSFWVYHDTEWGLYSDRVQVQVSTDGTSWTDLGAPVERNDGTSGWAQVSIDVSAYIGQTLWLGFVGISSYGNNIYLDDVAVTAQGSTSGEFALEAPSTVTAAQGVLATATISTTVTGGFNAAVALTVSGVPTGTTATISTTSIAAPGSGSATLTLTPGASTPAGTYTILVTGTGGKTHTATISFTVTTVTGQPASIVSASGSAEYGIYPYSLNGFTPITGTFTPSADGFETEVTEGFSTMYRWIDKTTNTRIEVSRGVGDSKWDAYLIRNSGDAYVLGTGTGFSPGVGLCSAGGCKVIVTGGTSLEKTVTVTFQALTPIGTAGSSSITGSLTGSANDFIWTPLDLPRSTSGLVTYAGRTLDILSAHGISYSVTVNGTTYNDIEFAIRMVDGSYITASKNESPASGMKRVVDIGILPPGLYLKEGACNSPDAANCEFDSLKRGDGTTRLYFPSIPIITHSGYAEYLDGAIEFSQASSTLQINGLPFSIDTQDYKQNWLSTYVSAVGATVRYQFLASEGGQITIWVRNGIVTQVLIPGANGSQFMCVEKPMLSTDNWWTGGWVIPYTIPACTGITVSSFPGEGLRIFNFNNFTLNVAPSVMVTPTKTVTLTGTLVAKGR
jgi:List-Bact-rpt repeat protein/Regulator of Chromosome Condensation (RCC1) repeat protein